MYGKHERGKDVVDDRIVFHLKKQPCQLIAGQHDHQASRSMMASGRDVYAAVGRVVSSGQVSNRCRIS